MHTSEWRVEPGSMTTWTKVMRGSDQDGDLEIVAKTYAIEGYSAEDVANLIAAAPEMLALLRRGADAVGALEADCDEAGVNCYPARHWWQDVDKLIDRIEGRSE